MRLNQRRACASVVSVRIVFDTNVLVTGLVAEGLCRELIETHIPEHTPILSQTLWNELVGTLRDKFQLSIL